MAQHNAFLFNRSSFASISFQLCYCSFYFSIVFHKLLYKMQYYYCNFINCQSVVTEFRVYITFGFRCDILTIICNCSFTTAAMKNSFCLNGFILLSIGLIVKFWLVDFYSRSEIFVMIFTFSFIC